MRNMLRRLQASETVYLSSSPSAPFQPPSERNPAARPSTFWPPRGTETMRAIARRLRRLEERFGIQCGPVVESLADRELRRRDPNCVSFRQGCVRPPESRFLLGQEAADGGSADLKLAGDFGFADSLPV